MSVDKIARAREAHSALVAYANTATAITDSQALTMPSLFAIWPNGVNDKGEYIQYQIINHKDQLYRLEQDKVKPIESQPPDGEGMLAVYRPIVIGHDGTLEDPIPFVYGMNTKEGLYYSYESHIYKCTKDMIPCVWAPGTPGAWWELVE